MSAATISAGPASPPSVARAVAGALFVVAVPVFLITTNVLQVTNDLAFYERGFARYGVAAQTGLSPAQLHNIGQAFIDYFKGAPDALDIQVEIGGSRRALFNQRELAHMEDVRELMSLVRRLQVLAGAILVAIPLLGFTRAASSYTRSFGALCLAGAALTLGILLLLGGLSLLDFGELFLQFHLLSFSNDLWMLDPSRDYLIMLFPEGFWFDAVMRIAQTTALEALAFAGVGLVLRRWGARA